LNVRLRANVLQDLLAQRIWAALTTLGENNDLIGYRLLNVVGTVFDTQSGADEFEGKAEDSCSLRVELFAVEEFSDWHDCTPCAFWRERDWSLSYRPMPDLGSR
jgi:hypothetical protein